MLLVLVDSLAQADPWTGPAIWALTLGIFGTVLGLVNVLWSGIQFRWRTKVSLRFRPAIGEVQSGMIVSSASKCIDGGFLVANIVNESHFPITVSRISVKCSAKGISVQPTHYDTYPEGSWPRKLDRKEGVMVSMPQITADIMLRAGVESVTLEASDGTVIRGTCAALKELHRQYRALPKDDLGFANTETANT